MHLLDTNVISELRRPRPHRAVPTWLDGIGDDLHLSAVTLGELHARIEFTREQDPEKPSESESWTDQVAQTWKVLPLDGRIFRVWARLMHWRSDDPPAGPCAHLRDVNSSYLVMVPPNVRDFALLEVATLNPFEVVIRGGMQRS